MKTKKRRTECNNIKDVVLANVGMTEEEFLTPHKKYHIKDLDRAASIIRRFIASNQNITVVGDYDCDGVCASAIMKLAIDALGGRIKIRLPKRFSEGYGLSEKIVNEINDGLLITVDNGIAAAGAIQKAKDKGLTVIVTDHHLAPEDGILPPADITIDPNVIPDSADFTGYCGAGIAYKLAIELLGSSHNLIPKLTSIAAIGTVADVMLLVEENRLIVQEGLKSMVTYKGRTTGLGALLEACRMDKYISAKDIGFKIGPMINAAGRMRDDGAETSFEALSFNGDFETAQKMAAELFAINEDRKVAKDEGLEKVHKNIIDNCLFGNSPMLIYEPDLPEGLVGIFAGKIAEEMHTPCFILTDSEEEGILKGSARTYGEVNIKDLLDACSKYLYKYGGHAEAAGLSVHKENLEKLQDALSEAMPEIDEADNNVVYYDLELSANNIGKAIDELDQFAPYGTGNPEIVFLIKNFELSPRVGGYYKTMGDKQQHIKLLGVQASALGFDMTEKYTDMGKPKCINIVGTLSRNYFMGKFSTQIEIIDMEPVNIPVPKTRMASMLSDMASKRR